MGRYKWLLVLFAGVSALAQADAEKWVVRFNKGNMNCYVEKSTAYGGQAQEIRGTYDSEEAACQAAIKLSSDNPDPSGSPTCDLSTYTISLCRPTKKPSGLKIIP